MAPNNRMTVESPDERMLFMNQSLMYAADLVRLYEENQGVKREIEKISKRLSVEIIVRQKLEGALQEIATVDAGSARDACWRSEAERLSLSSPSGNSLQEWEITLTADQPGNGETLAPIPVGTACVKGNEEPHAGRPRRSGAAALIRRYRSWRLLVSCEDGRTDQVRRLLDAGVDIDAKDRWGRSGLIKACCSGQLTVAELLTDRGANTEQKDVRGMTAFIHACRAGHLEIVRLLLLKGANPQAVNKESKSGYYYASTRGHLPVREFLTSRGIRI